MRVAVLSAVLVLSAGAAHANPPALTPPSLSPVGTVPVDAEPRGYARDVLIADGIGVALLVGGLATENGDVAALGVTSLVLATPIVHAAKGHPGRGLLSLTLRLGLPLAGSIMTIDSDAGPLVGGMLGGAAATGIDLLISHYGHHEEPAKVAPAVGRSWSGDGTTTYGLAGRF